MSSESEETDSTATDLDLKGHGLPFDWHARPKRTVPNMPGSSSRVYTDSDEAGESGAEDGNSSDFHDANGVDADFESGNIVEPPMQTEYGAG